MKKISRYFQKKNKSHTCSSCSGTDAFPRKCHGKFGIRHPWNGILQLSSIPIIFKWKLNSASLKRMPAVWFLSPHHFHHRYLAKFGPLLIIDGVWLSGLKEAILRRLFAFLTDPTLKIINHSFIIVVIIVVIMRLYSVILVRFLHGVIFNYLSKILTWCYLQLSK